MLELKNVSKIYSHNSSSLKIIDNLDLVVQDREFVVLLGPSGCGKSTLLKIIAGLVQPEEGELLLHGKKIIGPAQERGVVFQEFSLFPWLTVANNIAFGLNLKNTDSLKKQAMVRHYLKITGLNGFENSYPQSLSGGMRQRVAIARTLAADPHILLMDEPFASLDPQTRSQMQEFLAELWEKDKKTVLFVTHDIREAIFLANKILVVSSKPMNIKTAFNIPFSRPRKHSLKISKEFFELEQKIALELER